MITSNFHTSKPVFGWIQDYYVSYGVLLPREEIYKIGKITKNGEIKSYFPNNFELDGEFNKKLFESEIVKIKNNEGDNKNITDGIEILNEGFNIMTTWEYCHNTELLTVGKVAELQTGCVANNMIMGPLKDELFKDPSVNMCFQNATYYIDSDITNTANNVLQNKNKNDILENVLNMSGIDVNENVYNFYDMKSKGEYSEEMNRWLETLDQQNKLKDLFGYYICAYY